MGLYDGCFHGYVVTCYRWEDEPGVWGCNVCGRGGLVGEGLGCGEDSARELGQRVSRFLCQFKNKNL